MMDLDKMSKTRLGLMIITFLKAQQRRNGYTLKELADYLKINQLSLANMISKNIFGDLFVRIFELQGLIPEVLADAYRSKIKEEQQVQRKAKFRQENLKEVNKKVAGKAI